jgi:two-component system response regulator RstA
MSDTILLVDDDNQLNRLVVKFLGEHGFSVAVETNGEDAVERICREQPILVILDIMLPGRDGLSICRSVRPSYGGPILMLTGLGAEIDEVAGLETGADDYMAKPARPRVLLAHIRALLRRFGARPPIREPHRPKGGGETHQPASPQHDAIELASLNVDSRARRVTLRGEPIHLTDAEFDLLWLLASHAGEVLSRNDIYAQLRGFNYDGFDRTIDLRISRLRKKLGDDPRSPRTIKSVRGIGYLLVA